MPRHMYLSVDELWRLSNAVRPVQEALGNRTVWLVGSALERGDWRDVDLRVILEDEEYGQLFTRTQIDGTGMAVGIMDQFRMLLQTAISGLLRQATQLPIDFQIQSATEAAQYNGRRDPVCLRPYINSNFEPQWGRPVMSLSGPVLRLITESRELPPATEDGQVRGIKYVRCSESHPLDCTTYLVHRVPVYGEVEEYYHWVAEVESVCPLRGV